MPPDGTAAGAQVRHRTDHNRRGDNLRHIRAGEPTAATRKSSVMLVTLMYPKPRRGGPTTPRHCMADHMWRLRRGQRALVTSTHERVLHSIPLQKLLLLDFPTFERVMFDPLLKAQRGIEDPGAKRSGAPRHGMNEACSYRQNMLSGSNTQANVFC